MFIALDKLHNQGLQQAIVVVPERSIGGSFADEPLSSMASTGTGRWLRSGTCAMPLASMSRVWPSPRWKPCALS
jgi:hypothetical protein